MIIIITKHHIINNGFTNKAIIPVLYTNNA